MVTGIKLGPNEMRAQTFTDDTTLMIEPNKLSLQSCVKYIKASKTISGLSANLEKTKVIPI